MKYKYFLPDGGETIDENNVVTIVSVEIEYRPTFSGRVVGEE